MTPTPDEQRGIDWGTERLHALAAQKGMRLGIRWREDVDKAKYAITANVSGVSFTATMDAHDLADCGRGDQVQRAAAEITFGFTIDALQRRLSSPAN